MPDRHPDTVPLSRRTDLATAFTIDEQEHRTRWERLVAARLIGIATPLSGEARAAIAAMERALGVSGDRRVYA